MECAYQNNSNGFGVMFYNKGKVHTHKIVPKNFDDIKKMWLKYKDLNTSIGIHFRFTTVGDTKRSLSHPFQVLKKGENGSDRDLFVMHNGARLPTPIIDKDKSDTHQFIKWVIKPQLQNNPNLLYNAEWTEALEELIGSDKLLFLDGKTQEFTIINQDEGKDVKNVGWVSNTYSISRGVGFDYDIDKGKKVVEKKSSWLSDYDLYGNYNGRYSNYGTYSNKSYTTSWDNYDDELGDVHSNGEQLTDDDLAHLTVDEMIEIAETNPVGLGIFVHDLYNFGNEKKERKA
tara:strand:+ start:1675 stop:2535 length:861 start_codon:yes stop_codon:yes gene_type:complete